MGRAVAAAIALGAALWSTPTSDPTIDGRATFYSAGLMEQVASNRGMSLEGYAGGVALNRRADLGRTVWLEWFNPITKRAEISGPYKCVDVARQGADYEEREQRHLIVEVSWEQAQAWHMAGPIPIRVWFIDPNPSTKTHTAI